MIYVLGDSRTGTTSMHAWFMTQGLRSLHHFVAEAKLEDPLHRRREANWAKLRRFLHDSAYEAFSDYPVRAFFRELAGEFPDARFILTTRRDVQTWRGSMLRYFAGQKIDIDLLQAFHIAWNEEIRALFAESGRRLLDLCIDDDDAANGQLLAAFLGASDPRPMPHLNASAPPGQRLTAA